MTVAAHKIGGPVASGALYLKNRTPLRPRIFGGGQEAGRRAGTQDLRTQLAFAAAASALLPTDVLTDYERLLKQFRGLAVETIQGNIPTVCHTALQASSMSDLNHDGSEITHCPYCHRLLVLPSKEA